MMQNASNNPDWKAGGKIWPVMFAEGGLFSNPVV